MKRFTFYRQCVAALLLAMLPIAAISSARGDDWPAWMTKSKDSNEFESQLSMARLNERHGQHDAAIKIYNAVLAKQPKNQLAHHRLAVIAASNGDFTAADQHFSAALKYGPRTAEVMGDVGYALFLQNRLDEAEEALRKTLSEFPTYKKAHNSLGMVLGLKGRYEEALSEFRQVVSEAEAHANLAFVMVQVGDLEQASRHYHEAVKLNPSLRPAAEALVQLNGYKPGESSTVAPKPTARAKQSTSVATPATATARSRSMAKQSPADKIAFTPKQPQSLEAANTSNKALPADAKSASFKTIQDFKAGRQQSNSLQVAQPFAPRSPVVPTQSESSFAPAVIGLAKNDRLKPGIQASSSAHGEMMAQQEREDTSLPTADTVSTDANTSAASVTVTEIPVSDQQESPDAKMEKKTVSAIAQDTSNAEEVIRAQVFTFAPPPISQVSVSDESVELPSEEPEVEISDQESLAEMTEESDESAEATAAVLVPGAYALAAARAQADLLTQIKTNEPAVEPGFVPILEIPPIPLPPAAEYEAVSQAEAIPVDISAKNTTALPASFIISPEAIPSPSTATKEIGNPLVATPVVQEATNSSFMATPPAPWQIVLLTLAGTFGLLTLGKTVRHLSRRKVSSKVSAPESPQSSAQPAPQKHEAEETYTYLEGQIRDVCAGLPANGRSADRIRKA